MPIPTRALHDGVALPAVGFGTYPMRGTEAVTAVRSALDAGYRLIDTAVNYGNEAEVGEAVRTAEISREEVFVTSKLPGRHHGYDEAIESTRESLQRMGLDYIDLHLIHWPNPSVGKYPDAWRALIQLQRDGLVRSIGVSNFAPGHLHRIIDETGVTPVVNQIELHPYFPQESMRALHAQLGIQTESWSPLGKRSAPFSEPAVTAPAENHNVTPGQVILRWQVQIGSIPIPKSADPERQRDNLDIFGFELSSDELDAISALGRRDGRLFGGDPAVHEEM
jgi:diketogulonate reductase-like aldo/keto reductase